MSQILWRWPKEGGDDKKEIGNEHRNAIGPRPLNSCPEANGGCWVGLFPGKPIGLCERCLNPPVQVPIHPQNTRDGGQAKTACQRESTSKPTGPAPPIEAQPSRKCQGREITRASG